MTLAGYGVLVLLGTWFELPETLPARVRVKGQ